MSQRCRLITIALAAVAVSLKLVPFQTSPAYTGDAQLEAKRAPADFAVDGNVDKKLWKRANWAEFIHNMAGNRNYPEQATRVASLWTDSYVYFAFSCRYDVLNVFEGEDIAKEKWELWNRDVAEIFLNPQPERQLHYYEFEVAPNNRWIDLEITRGENPNHDASWNSGFEHATRVNAKNHIWTAEFKIPLASMGISQIKPGTEWRANFFRAGGKGDDTQRTFLAWSTIPEGRTFHAPARFGILRLVQ